MMDPYYDFSADADHHSDQNGKKHIGKDNGFTNALGPPRSHNLHDDHEHRATQNE